jgi:hypothetical protein
MNLKVVSLEGELTPLGIQMGVRDLRANWKYAHDGAIQ